MSTAGSRHTHNECRESERDISQVLELVGTVILKLVGTVKLKLVSTRDHLEIVKMADRFWKSMPAALNRPTLNDFYRRLRDLDYTQVDERMAVMLHPANCVQGVCDRSCLDGRLHDRRHIQSRKDQVAVLEGGLRGKRIRLGKESWLEQQH